MWISHNKIEPREVAELYRGHEVAAHTLTHPFLPELDDEEIIRQIEEDRKNLEKLLGKDIVGLAYPGGGIGGVNTNEHIISLIRKNSKIKYARTTICNGSFDTQDNLLEFHPTAYHLNFDEIMELGEKFIKLKTEEKKIFYVWGHSYEFDRDNNWYVIEEFCKMIGGREDIWYATNAEVCHYLMAVKQVHTSVDEKLLFNGSGQDIYLIRNGENILLHPGELQRIHSPESHGKLRKIVL